MSQNVVHKLRRTGTQRSTKSDEAYKDLKNPISFNALNLENIHKNQGFKNRFGGSVQSHLTQVNYLFKFSQ